MKRYDEVLVVQLDSGKTICVIAPYGKAETGDLVKTTNGLMGEVIKKAEDFSGYVRAITAEFTAVYEASDVWGHYWEAEATEDA